jgi:protein-S-isoprenylcysteine O-methyltransferase Ste14
MNTSELLWVVSVVASTIILHFLIRRSIAFYQKRYTGENERLPGYIHTIQRTLLMLIWLVATFLCSYVFFQEEMYETITTHLLRSIWIGSVVLVCVILNAICLNFFDRRIAEYSEAEEKDPTTHKFSSMSRAL